MKLKIILSAYVLILLFNKPCLCQEDNKTVILTTSGQGITKEDAKNNALRNAVEQAFGTFVSSKTEIFNDQLSDEIISIANGNIQNYDYVSEIQLPTGGYVTTVKVVVSITKLTQFAESKGISVEFKGSLFAINVNQQILNEKNEIKAVENLCKVARILSDMSFDYAISVNEPIAVDASNDKWCIKLNVSVIPNDNILKLIKYINQTLKGLSLSFDEAINYKYSTPHSSDQGLPFLNLIFNEISVCCYC